MRLVARGRSRLGQGRSVCRCGAAPGEESPSHAASRVGYWLSVLGRDPKNKYVRKMIGFYVQKKRGNPIDPFAIMAAAASLAWNLAMSREVKRLREQVEGKRSNSAAQWEPSSRGPRYDTFYGKRENVRHYKPTGTPRGGARPGAGRKWVKKRWEAHFKKWIPEAPGETPPTFEEMKETENFFRKLKDYHVLALERSPEYRRFLARSYGSMLKDIKKPSLSTRLKESAIRLLKETPVEVERPMRFLPGPMRGGRRIFAKTLHGEYEDNPWIELYPEDANRRRYQIRKLTPPSETIVTKKEPPAVRSKRKNPTLLVATNPSPPDKQINPRLMRNPQFRKALAKYREFFGDDPVEIIEAKDAPKGLAKHYKFLVGLGRAPEVTYAPHKETPKGKGPPFMHKWEYWPVLAMSPDEKFLGYLDRGRGYKVRREGIHG